MTIHISLKRRFAPPDSESLRDPSFRTLVGETPEGIMHWDDLLTRSPVVVIGEGKCGKTYEFQRQVDELKALGTFAFFVPIERLVNQSLNDVFSPEDEADFERWRESDAPAFIFLDALDELKLRDGSFRDAFNKLRRAVGTHMSRLRLLISCRPGDPSVQFDLEELTSFSTVQTALQTLPQGPIGEEAFREVIERGEQGHIAENEDKEAPKTSVACRPLIVALLPLENHEIRECAELYMPDRANTFCDVLDDQELWHLYRLPDDIMKALDYMARHDTFGTIEEQLRAGIEQKLSERPDRRPALLASRRALDGVERIALATVLMKKRSIRIDGAGGVEVLSVADILPDFTTAEHGELVGKSIFDPSGVGLVRFHHRETQEYLAAQKLVKLRAQGLPTNDLLALLFGEIAGEEVVKPSMEAVAAWMAMSQRDVLGVLKRRKPQLLFSAGLPGSMSVDLRADLLRGYVERYQGSGWRRAGIGHGKLRQIAHPGLASVVRELWNAAYTGHDTLEILLELILLTPLPDCADLALLAVQDSSLEIGHLTFAGRGVLASGTSAQKSVLKSMCLAGSLPETVIRYLLPDLFPDVMDPEEFWGLVDGMTELPNTVHGLGYAVLCAVKGQGLSVAERIVLRDRFTDAVWSSRTPESRMYGAWSTCDHYLDAVLAICLSDIPEGDDDLESWAWSVAIAFHFGERRGSIIARDEIKGLEEILNSSTALRAAFFWACIRVGDALEGREDDWERFIRATSETRRGLFIKNEDRQWLLDALEVRQDRGIAYHALIWYFDVREETSLSDDIRTRISDLPDLLDHLEKVLNPVTRQPDEHDLKHERWKSERRAEEAERVEGWVTWRSEIMSDPDFGMEDEGRRSVLYNMASILRQARHSTFNWGEWDGELIERIMSGPFLERLRIEFAIFWRDTNVLLRSERPVDKQGTFRNDWLLALTAAKCDAETSEWAGGLTDTEARQAARVACLEMNGFAGFLAMLEDVHPDAVATVIAGEAIAQMRVLGATGDAAILHDVLHHDSDRLRTAVAHAITLEFASVAETEGNALEYGARIVAEHGDSKDIAAAASAIDARVDEGPIWLGLLSHLNVATASLRLLEVTAELETAEQRASAADLFVAVFGDRWSSRVARFDAVTTVRQVPLLRDLVVRAYQVVRRDEDVQHQGTYSPDNRDYAEGARSALFDRLIATQQVETVAALQDLASLSEFSHMPDRLHEMAREVAARVSDEGPMPLYAFRSISEDLAFAPHNRASLFQVMSARLDDFEHDLLEGENSTIDTLRKVDQETHLRRFISSWLNAQSRGAYSTTQEAVARAENRTDIRIQPNMFDEHATIELKLDDTRQRWSGSALESALRDQLIGRYLNHEKCRVGCLLIVMRETRRWTRPDTGERMTLIETVDWLQRIADQVCHNTNGLYIAVKGIDCTV